MKRVRSLQFQITFMLGIILVLVCFFLTVHSIYSANNNYADLAEYVEMYGDEEEETFQQDFNPAYMEEDVIKFSDMMRSFSIQGTVVMVGTILVSLLLIYWVTGRMLKPLADLTNSIRRIDEEHLHQRLDINRDTLEVEQLTHSFNGMMERLDESFRIQKRFAANAAHELKTPLAVIKTSLQVLNMDAEPSREDYREFTGDLEESLERLIRTVDGLLFLAKDQLETEEETIHLKELTAQILRHLSQRALECGVTLTLEGADPCIKGDQTLIYRGLYNIIENGIKYNNRGGNVKTSLESRVGEAVVQVQDTGIGMSEKDIRYLFDPFYRADQSRSQKIQGAGLGMSIVKLIFDRYQGTIEVESAEGKGTSIKITFPCT